MVHTGGMTRTEQIRKARHDVDLLQQGLDKVGSALDTAEQVALVGEQARRRAPIIVASLLGVAAIAVGVVYLRRRRHQKPSDDDVR